MTDLPSNLPERIFLDTSYTIGSGKSSGIERVVRSLIRELSILGTEGQIPVPQPVVTHRGKFYAVEQEQIEQFREFAQTQSNVLRAAPDSYKRSAEIVCRLSGSKRLRKWLLPQPGHLGLFKVPHTMKEGLILNRVARTAKEVRPGAGDLVILPDAYWINRLRASVWPAAADARQAGAIVSTVIYDLIPLTHPHFVGSKRRDAFRDYLIKAVANSDQLISISATVQDQLAEFLAESEEYSAGYSANLSNYVLGAELSETTGTVRETVQKLFGGAESPYLTVATFDPRKNHPFLLDAFELLWKQDRDQNLCLVGRIGARCDGVVQRIRQHPLLGKRLHLFDDLTDAELHYCYRQSKAVLFPSVAEGFGLPIVEALWHGKTTFASDTPIHREVGKDDCEYFSLECPSKLAEVIEQWEKGGCKASTPAAGRRQPFTWRQSTEQFLQRCLDNYSARLNAIQRTKAA